MSAPENKPTAAAATTTGSTATPIHLPPHIWGPIFWSTLHIASLGYSDTPTERQRKNAQAFYESLVDMLPCPICRNHYEQNLEEMPIKDALKSRMDLVKWVFDMHNRINVQLGKHQITFGEFIRTMQNLEKAKESRPPSHTNQPTKSTLHHNRLDAIDGLLLGTGTVLIAGAGLYYLYTEVLRRTR
jgi:FAD-linked sulfhydryl oxidase